jgi:hypothetical protein
MLNGVTSLPRRAFRAPSISSTKLRVISTLLRTEFFNITQCTDTRGVGGVIAWQDQIQAVKKSLGDPDIFRPAWDSDTRASKFSPAGGQRIWFRVCHPMI